MSANQPYIPRQVEQYYRVGADGHRREGDFQEYADPKTGERFLIIGKQSASIALHEMLQARHIPVPPRIESKTENFTLRIPSDARLIRQLLPVLARDALSYGEVFRQMGSICGKLQLAGIGLPVSTQERGITDSFIFGHDSDEEFGGAVLLVPPYEFDPTLQKQEVLGHLRDELVQSSYMSEASAEYFRQAAFEGWYGRRP